MRGTKNTNFIGLRLKGSFSIEAAATLPLFLVGLLTLASLLLMLEFRMKMQASLLFVAENLAKETADGHNVALSDVKKEICDFIGTKEDLYKYVLNKKDGIDFSKSKLDNPEFVELTAEYVLVPFSDLFGLLSIPVSDRCVMHVWCGYQNGFFDDTSGEYVYVAKGSEVYHSDRECSHIKLNILKTDTENIKFQRNEDGGKYYGCEICKARPGDGVLYITTDGDRYHNTVSCPGLKRTVRSLRLDKALQEGLRPCKRCGK